MEKMAKGCIEDFWCKEKIIYFQIYLAQSDELIILATATQEIVTVIQ